MVNINSLLNTSFLSERQQNDPDVGKSESIVSFKSGVCLDRAEPVDTVCVMVVFPSLGNELQLRNFLERLDSEHSSSATSVKVKVPAILIGPILFDESAVSLTLTWSKNTRKAQVQGPLTLLDTMNPGATEASRGSGPRRFKNTTKIQRREE